MGDEVKDSDGHYGIVVKVGDWDEYLGDRRYHVQDASSPPTGLRHWRNGAGLELHWRPTAKQNKNLLRILAKTKPPYCRVDPHPDCRSVMTTKSATYDELALDAMLDTNKARGQKRIDTLLAHSKGQYACPDCGHEGPHHVQGDEYACANCGMQHPVPEV